MFRRETPHPLFSYLIYLGCLVSFVTISFNWSQGRNIFFVTSYVAFIALIFNPKYYTKRIDLLWAPLLFVAVGLGSILWVAAYKQPGEYINLYRAFMVTGKLLVATGFVLLIALNERINFSRLIKPALLLLGASVNLYIIYQGVTQGISRSELNFDRATIAAYIITAVDLLMIYTLLHVSKKHRIILFALGFTVSYIAIIHTQTRAAILAFPIISIIMFLVDKDITKKQKYISCLSMIALLFLSGFFLKNIIDNRIEEFKIDMSTLSDIHTSRENSVGSRISMSKAGTLVGNQHLFGQSAEQRGNEISTLVAKNPLLAGVLPYTTIHMHNELVDTYSLRGIWGGLLLIALYLSLLWLSLRSQKNTALLAMTITIITYGLSDVLFFSSEATGIFGIAVILSVLIGKHTATTVQIADNQNNANP